MGHWVEEVSFLYGGSEDVHWMNEWKTGKSKNGSSGWGSHKQACHYLFSYTHYNEFLHANFKAPHENFITNLTKNFGEIIMKISTKE